jgi:outer membrane lipase/esterase
MLEKLKKLVLGDIKRILLVSAGILCGCVINVTHAMNLNTISQVYFFGDSLTDSGFNDLWPTLGIPGAPLPFGKAPTFTTYGGYTWAQYVARDIKGFPLPVYPGPSIPDLITNNSIFPVPRFVSATLHGVDYAAGGSTTNSGGFIETWAPSLHQQVSHYLTTVGPAPLDPNAVYFIWSGANDFLTALSPPNPIPTQLQLLQIAQATAINIASEVSLLSSRGAKRIVVISLPNLGLAPFASSSGNASLPALLKTLSFTFNSMLNTQLGKIIKQFGTKILFIDVYTLLGNVVDATNAGKPFVIAGQSFSFINAKDPACVILPPSPPSAIYCPSTAPTGYVFADTVHPTDMAHRVISLAVETQMQSW